MLRNGIQRLALPAPRDGHARSTMPPRLGWHRATHAHDGSLCINFSRCTLCEAPEHYFSWYPLHSNDARASGPSQGHSIFQHTTDKVQSRLRLGCAPSPGMIEGEAHSLQSRCSQSLPLNMGWVQKNIETRPCAWQRVIRIAQKSFRTCGVF
jgi:hypothetical protein